jgi:DNA-binding NarL/FixJ family response regulator
MNSTLSLASARTSGARIATHRTRAGTRPTVLCIEHDKVTLARLAEDLIGRGYRVTVAHDGRDGLAAILASQPDLVVCDVSAPVMSGFELRERVNEYAPRFRATPFVFLTALTDWEVEPSGRQQDGDEYVTKPIDFDVLDAIITTRLARAPRQRARRTLAYLTLRELETLTWSARGKTSEDIGQILGLTRRTVDFHLDNARHKLGVATRIEAVATAVSMRLIEV